MLRAAAVAAAAAAAAAIASSSSAGGAEAGASSNVHSGAAALHLAEQVGYQDVSSFSRLFKRHTGLSPSHYRQRFARVGSLRD